MAEIKNFEELKKGIEALKVGNAYEPNVILNESLNAGLTLALMKINSFEAGLKRDAKDERIAEVVRNYIKRRVLGEG